MIHPTSDVQTKQIGEGTRIWQYCVVLPNAHIGSDCNICSHCFIENDVVIGNRVTVKCGVQIWDGITLEDDVFVGPNVTFTNDMNPRSQQHPESFLKTLVKQGASIGANATILPGLVIGVGAMVGAGSVVTSNVPPGAVVIGNPARITRYDTANPALKAASPSFGQVDQPIDESFSLAGAKWIVLSKVTDARGDLTIAQWDKHLPFKPARSFFVQNVSNAKVRGEHAHRECEQVLVALSGSVAVVLDDGKTKQEFALRSSDCALLIPAGIWATQYNYSHDCVLAVFASHNYDESDYIRSYDDYLAFRTQ